MMTSAITTTTSSQSLSQAINSNNHKMNKHNDLAHLCPFSIISLKFFITFPVLKLIQLLGFSNLCSALLLISIYFLVALIFKLAMKIKAISNCMTLIKHTPEPDHPHDTRTFASVVAISLLLSFIALLGITIISDNLVDNSSNGRHATFVSSLPLGMYLVLLSFFHFSEYFVTSLTNPSSLSLSSFLIDQSSYSQAIFLSAVEYLVEFYLFPSSKHFNLISKIGLGMAVCGETIRKCAIFTAGKNFSHLIKSTKDPDHKLVTHGIYKLMRHPSYAGWYYWAIGSQILLLNPICTILFAVISNCFFYDRIEYEEGLLIEFFGNDYKEYRRKVPLWVPLWDINPYLLSLERKYKCFRQRI